MIFGKNWLRELFSSKSRRGRGSRRLAKIRNERRLVRDVRVSELEERLMLTFDFGDAPDPSNGTAANNYQTRDADGGPKHTIVAGLKLGANVDGEADAFP